MQVSDHRSKSHCVKVTIGGVPMYGIIDSGADITIMGGGLFQKLATHTSGRRTSRRWTKCLAHIVSKLFT